MKHLRLFKDCDEYNAADLEYPTLSLIQEDNSTITDETPPTIIAKYVFEEDIPEGTPCFYSEVNGDNSLTPRSFTSFEVNGEEMIVNNPIINLGSITPTASSLDPLSFSEDSFLPAETTYAEIKFSKPVTYLGIYIEPGQVSVMPISLIQQEFPQLITVYSDDSIRFNCANFLEMVGMSQVRMVLFSSDSETPESIEEINSYTPIINSYSGGISLDANLRSWPAGEYTVKMEFDRRDWGQFNGFFLMNPFLREIYCKGNFSNGIYSSDFCQGAYNLQSVSIFSKNFIEEVGNSAFRNCTGLTSINIPESVTSIRSETFSGCSSLTSITLPEGVTSIGEWAFRSCSSLTAINIPKSVTSIRRYAFYNCSSLTSITIPESVTSIGEYAFTGCSNLASINIPESVTSIGTNALGDTAWYNNQPDGVVYVGKVLYKYKGTMPENTSIEIKEGTLSIGGYAFYNCSSLTSITIPESVTSIGSEAFYGCGGELIVNCNIPSDLNYSGAFYNSQFTKVTIGEGVTSIGDYAFRGCRSLTSITIPEGVTSIGDHAFAYCSDLTSITNKAITPQSVYNYTFDGVKKSIPVYVPTESVDAYKAAAYWSEFTNFQAIS